MTIAIDSQIETYLLQEGQRVTAALQQVRKEIDAIINPTGSDRNVDNTFKKYHGKEANFVYCCYPFLFSSAFPKVPIHEVRKIALSARFMLEYLLINDFLVDSKNIENVDELTAGGLIQYKSLNLLYQLFEPQSSFWDYFGKYYKEYVCAVALEKRNHFDKINPYGRLEMEQIAAGKAALGKFVIAALGVLGEAEEKIVPLEKSHDYLSIGLQLWDDLRDWRADFQQQRYSYLLTNLLMKHGFSWATVDTSLPDSDSLSRMLHFSGAVELIMEKTDEYFEKAISSLRQFGPLPWRDWIKELKREVEDLLSDYRRVKNGILPGEKLNDTQEITGHLRVSGEEVASSIRRGVEFINSSISNEGCWQDFLLITGKSKAWMTGYIGQLLLLLIKLNLGSEQTRTNIKKAQEWVVAAADEKGGWGYNRWSGVDADSTSNCLLFLSECEDVPEEVVAGASEVIVKNQNCADGGIGTFSMMDIKSQIEKGNPWFPPPLKQYRGWCSSDTYITGVAAYTLMQLNKGRYWDRILQSVDFITKEQSRRGYWNAYWSNGKIIGTFACTRLLKKLDLARSAIESSVNWVQDIQFSHGGWSNGVSEKATPLDTALALQILLITDGKKRKEMIDRGIHWLVTSQLSDGSWKSFPWMTVPRCNTVKSYRADDYDYSDEAVRDHMRLFTTATVLFALSYYQSMD